VNRPQGAVHPAPEGDKIQLGTVTAFRFSFPGGAGGREDRLQRAMRATGVGAFEWSLDSGEVLLRSAPSGSPRCARLLAAVHPEDREHLRDLLAAAAGPRARRVEVECA